MIISLEEIKKMIFEDQEKLANFFCKRDDDFFDNFKLFSEVLSEEKDLQFTWDTYFIFKNSQSLLTKEEYINIDEKIRKVNKIFGDLSLWEIELNILEALTSPNVEKLNSLGNNIEDYLFGIKKIPNRLIEVLAELLMNDAFLYAEGSSHILNFLHFECESISSEQWNYLLPYIESSYSKFEDWMSCFILTEIIGNDFPTKESLTMIINLKTVENELYRSYIPNALMGFVKCSPDLKIKKAAYDNLMLMTNDSSAIVVKESLRACKAVEEIVFQMML